MFVDRSHWRVPVSNMRVQWAQYTTADGVPYYFNNFTGVTTYEPPTGFGTTPNPASSTVGMSARSVGGAFPPLSSSTPSVSHTPVVASLDTTPASSVDNTLSRRDVGAIDDVASGSGDRGTADSSQILLSSNAEEESEPRDRHSNLHSSTDSTVLRSSASFASSSAAAPSASVDHDDSSPRDFFLLPVRYGSNPSPLDRLSIERDVKMQTDEAEELLKSLAEQNNFAVPQNLVVSHRTPSVADELADMLRNASNASETELSSVAEEPQQLSRPNGSSAMAVLVPMPAVQDISGEQSVSISYSVPNSVGSEGPQNSAVDMHDTGLQGPLELPYRSTEFLPLSVSNQEDFVAPASSTVDVTVHGRADTIVPEEFSSTSSAKAVEGAHVLVDTREQEPILPAQHESIITSDPFRRESVSLSYDATASILMPEVPPNSASLAVPSEADEVEYLDQLRTGSALSLSIGSSDAASVRLRVPDNTGGVNSPVGSSPGVSAVSSPLASSSLDRGPTLSTSSNPERAPVQAFSKLVTHDPPAVAVPVALALSALSDSGRASFISSSFSVPSSAPTNPPSSLASSPPNAVNSDRTPAVARLLLRPDVSSPDSSIMNTPMSTVRSQPPSSMLPYGSANFDSREPSGALCTGSNADLPSASSSSLGVLVEPEASAPSVSLTDVSAKFRESEELGSDRIPAPSFAASTTSAGSFSGSTSGEGTPAALALASTPVSHSNEVSSIAPLALAPVAVSEAAAEANMEPKAEPPNEPARAEGPAVPAPVLPSIQPPSDMQEEERPKSGSESARSLSGILKKSGTLDKDDRMSVQFPDQLVSSSYDVSLPTSETDMQHNDDNRFAPVQRRVSFSDILLVKSFTKNADLSPHSSTTTTPACSNPSSTVSLDLPSLNSMSQSSVPETQQHGPVSNSSAPFADQITVGDSAPVTQKNSTTPDVLTNAEGNPNFKVPIQQKRCCTVCTRGSSACVIA